MILEGLLQLLALTLAGIIGALIAEPAKAAVRVTADRVRSQYRR